uniref:Fidgetin-like protein 1 n=1 Tax=Cacopsylla melanoneura TaxID=428564 RepID=A0A8D8T2S0_9HEMI
MDHLIDFDSESDSHEMEEEIEADNEPRDHSFSFNNNRIKLEMFKAILEDHDTTVVEECKFYNEQVNNIVVTCKLDKSRIKCLEWKSELNVNNLADKMKPSNYVKCQLNASNGQSIRNPLQICRNYIHLPTRRPKPTPNPNPGFKPSDHLDAGTSSCSSFNISSSESSITFNFKPNYNITNSSVQINSTKLSTNENHYRTINANESRQNVVQSSTNVPTGFGAKSSSINNVSLNNVQNVTKVNPFDSNGKHNGDSNGSNYGNNYQPCTSKGVSSYFGKPKNVPTIGRTGFINGPKNGAVSNGRYFVNEVEQGGSNSKGFVNGPLKRGISDDRNEFINGTMNGVAPNGRSFANLSVKGPVSNGERNADQNEDPFSFPKYYKREENLGKQGETFEKRYDKQDEHQLGSIQKTSSFRTARTELGIQNLKKDKGKPGGNYSNYNGNQSGAAGASANWVSNSIKKTLGTTKARSVRDKFVTPMRPNDDERDMQVDGPSVNDKGDLDECEDERYKGIDKVMIERIENEIMDRGKPVTWDDIAGLTFAKQTIQEVIVWPMLRPDIFTGLRRPPKGILLFGPPGTGKTLIGKCVAAQCKATFFCISASTLTSKWYGEGEKMVRALFAVASVHQPSIIFIDEIDSLLCQRSDQENETSRRLKTEFLISLDGAGTLDDDLVLVIGATNRPQELDEAARRRLVKRLYIPLPDEKARAEIVTKLLANITNSLTVEDIEEVARLTNEFSGADMSSLCREASLGPVRSIDLSKIDALDVRPIKVEDFRDALNTVRPSVCQADLKIYQDWNQTFGSGRC